MATKYLDTTGLTYLWGKIKSWVQNYTKITTENSSSTITIGNTSLTPVLKDGDKVLSDNNYTTAEQTKLAGIAAGAEVNQNAFSNVKVGSTTIAADGKTDTLEFVAGGDVTLTPDATNDKVTISVTLPTSLSQLTNDSGFITTSDIPEGAAASTTTPLMDGTAATGTELAFARGDHRHPSDSSKADVATTLAGYGITDANIANGVITLGSNTITPLTSFTETDPTVPAWAKASTKPSYDYSEIVHTPENVSEFTNDAGYLTSSVVGAASGVCPLNGHSKIDSSYLPSYVDDVVEAYARAGQTALSQNWLATGSASGTVITPEEGKIYVLMADSGDYSANSQFRWGGTAYIKLNDGGVSAITNSEIDSITAN